jgi:hypothetical protein
MLVTAMTTSHGYRVDEAVILFSRESHGIGRFLNRFSVGSQSSMQANSRAIVCHDGGDQGEGEWVCTKDGAGMCLHVKIARDHLQKLLQENPNATAEGMDEVVDINIGQSGWCLSH